MGCLLALIARAEQVVDTVPGRIYQGVLVKLDLLMPAVEAGRTGGRMQDYEMSVSVRLKNRFYPVWEGGYAFGRRDKDNSVNLVHGGFMRFGCDFNGLRKNAHKPSALLIGVRLGTAYQQFRYTNVSEQDLEAAQGLQVRQTAYRRSDVWGELVGGCQVQIVSGFYMGWHARLKLLFTRKQKGSTPLPNYIPGYGDWNDTSWGVNYYIGWMF